MKMAILKEQYGSDSVRKVFVASEEGKLTVNRSTKRWTSVVQNFKSVFLPQGYPDSVSDDYTVYQVWDTLQAFCSSITGALAAQAVLKGVGVGDANATLLAASLTWLIKDGTGMVGRILFAWMQGGYLDCDCKRWRLFADMLNDAAICMEILASSVPGCFTAIVCIAGVCKSIVGVAGGATRAALTQHQARRNNLADVSAKDGSQETLVNLMALLCNLLLIPYVTGHQPLIWFFFIVFTFLHLFSNYRAVTCVRMSVLNQARLHIVMEEYLKTGSVPSVAAVNANEPVVLRTPWNLECHLGCSAQNAVKTCEDLKMLKQIYSESNYLLTVNQKSQQVYVIFSEFAEHEDYLQAAIQFELLNFVTTYRGKFLGGLRDTMANTHFKNLTIAAQIQPDSDLESLLLHSSKWVKHQSKSLCEDLKASGWNLERVLFHIDEWRAEWRDARLKQL